MATNEIVQKLNSMMQEKDVFTQERDVVYFLVQLRKLMEREGIFDQHEVVKFYCDWVVHPNKEYNHRHMVEIYDAIYDECIKGLNEIMDTTTDSMFSLLKFDNLKENVKPLIEGYGLSVPLMDSLWPRFAKTMLRVLNDQPFVISLFNVSTSLFDRYRKSVCAVGLMARPRGGFIHYLS